MLRILALCASVLTLAISAFARAADDASTLPKVDPAAIKADIVAFSTDEMNGRYFRSEEGARAATWLADKLAAAGAKPLEGRDSKVRNWARTRAASSFSSPRTSTICRPRAPARTASTTAPTTTRAASRA
jgi:hypothetical protein